MLNVPAWRKDPEPVFINCAQVQPMPDEDEYIVQFECRRGNFTSFVPKKYVDVEGKKLHALIIADVEGKGVLLALPEETLTSGQRLLVFEDEKDQVLDFSGGGKNGTK